MRIFTTRAALVTVAATFLGLTLAQNANAEYLYNTTWETMVTPTMFLQTAPTVGCNSVVSNPVVIDRGAVNYGFPTTLRTVTQPVIVTGRESHRLFYPKSF